MSKLVQLPKYVENRYGLTEDPFRLSPDLAYTFLHDAYKDAIDFIKYALQRAEGFVIVSGVPGTGKTTLVSNILLTLDKSDHVAASISCISAESNELIRIIARSFGCDVGGKSRSSLYLELKDLFEGLVKNGKRPVLIIDEAQGLSDGALEEIRLLSNLQMDNRLLLQIILVGQESIHEMRKKPNFENLGQRVIAATTLKPLSYRETTAYILHRLEHAGWTGLPRISSGAFAQIYRYSRGIPRLINLIANRILLYAMKQDLDSVSEDDTRYVIDELLDEGVIDSGRKPTNVSELEQNSVGKLLDEVVQPLARHTKQDQNTNLEETAIPQEQQKNHEPFIREIESAKSEIVDEIPIRQDTKTEFQDISPEPVQAVTPSYEQGIGSKRVISGLQYILLSLLLLSAGVYAYLKYNKIEIDADVVLDRIFQYSKHTESPDPASEGAIATAPMPENVLDETVDKANPTVVSVYPVPESSAIPIEDAPVAPVSTPDPVTVPATSPEPVTKPESQIIPGATAERVTDAVPSEPVGVEVIKGIQATQVVEGNGSPVASEIIKPQEPSSTPSVAAVNSSPPASAENPVESLGAEENFLVREAAVSRKGRSSDISVLSSPEFDAIPGLRLSIMKSAIFTGNWTYEGEGSKVLPSGNTSCYPQDDGNLKCVGRTGGVLKMVSYLHFSGAEQREFMLRFARLDDRNPADSKMFDLSGDQSNAPAIRCKMEAADNMTCIGYTNQLFHYKNIAGSNSVLPK